MKRYYIFFQERVKGSNKWRHVTTEDYDDLQEAKDRFFKAIAASTNSIDSVSMRLTDRQRVRLEMKNDDLLTFTYIVD